MRGLGEGVRNRAYFPPSRFRFTRKAGSSVCTVTDVFTIALLVGVANLLYYCQAEPDYNTTLRVVQAAVPAQCADYTV